jgi:hypothetical protein
MMLINTFLRLFYKSSPRGMFTAMPRCNAQDCLQSANARLTKTDLFFCNVKVEQIERGSN